MADLCEATPYTQFIRHNRLYNRFVQPVKQPVVSCIHSTDGLFSNRLTECLHNTEGCPVTLCKQGIRKSFSGLKEGRKLNYCDLGKVLCSQNRFSRALSHKTLTATKITGTYTIKLPDLAK